MKIPVQRWERAIKLRYSSRRYDSQPLSGEVKEGLRQFIDAVNSRSEGVRAVLVTAGGDKVVHSVLGSYGLFTGVCSYLALLAMPDDQYFYEKTGYLGEMCILEATALGLGTCWISGTFKPRIVKQQLAINPTERVMAIIPLGTAKTQKGLLEKVLKKAVGSMKRKSLAELCPAGYQQNWPEWIKTAINLARLAPSALNRQPWRFYVDQQMTGIKITVDQPTGLERKRLDCGIAMLHLEVGALSHGIKGRWCYLDRPDIAIYQVD